jgi:hypothetical protein
MNKKSQSAMEFLMSYGWALLVALIIIAILIYIGVLSPSRFLPDSINFGSGIHVADYSISFFENHGINMGYFVILIKNGLGRDMRNVVLNIKECENNNGKKSIPININQGKIEKITLACENILMNLEEQAYFTATLTYDIITEQESLSHTRNGKMKVTVNRIKEFPDNNIGRKAWAIENGASRKNDANRFFPCDDIPDCTNPDPEGIFKKIFGGYVDSMTGKVWLEHDAPDNANYTWSELNLTSIHEPKWDTISPKWNHITKKYDYSGDVYLPFRDDKLGTAFEYCTNLIKHNKNDWKLPNKNDFADGILNCNQCLPPYGTYKDTNKFYWTEGYSEPEYGECINFPNTYVAKCSKDAKLHVRCIRDNP